MTKKLAPQEQEAFHPVEKKTTDEVQRENALETASGRFSVWSTMSMTGFEKKVWRFLGKEDNPWLFEPQVPMLGYLLDFYSKKFMLAIEADGPDHRNQEEQDLERDEVLMKNGIRTLRITPRDFVMNSKQALVDVIEEFIKPKHVLLGGPK